MITLKTLKVDNGIIALVSLNGYDFNDRRVDVSLHVVEYGILMKVNDIEIPIPESMFEYFVDNSNVTIYPYEADNYFSEPIFTVSIPKDSFIEIKAVYNYWKATRKEEKEGSELLQ